MKDVLEKKIKSLPVKPGVYFYKDKTAQIIYIGKAAVLRNRVRQYFQKSRARDPKTEVLIAEITDVEWIEVETEIDALFLEAEMIRRYLPKYNILLRDDKSLLYVRIDINSDYPTVTFTRRPLDDAAKYFGPYINGYALKKALRLLRKIFPYVNTKNQATLGSKLYEQIGLDPGLSSGKTSLEAYKKNLRLLMSYLRGNRTKLMQEIEKDMKKAAKSQNFELAGLLKNKLVELKSLKKQIIFSNREFMDISKDKGLYGLAQILSIEAPKRIEGYDISHMSGTDNVASMVVFTNGMPDKTSYRKFKMHLKGNNDFGHIYEVISRRLSPRNVKSWGLPDLFLIDGGKGQLSSAIQARDLLGFNIPMVGLAKREEEIVVDIAKSSVLINTVNITKIGGVVTGGDSFNILRIPHSHDVVKLLQRIRDESHRFAITYHGVLKRKRQTSSWLEEVPSIGVMTKKKLIKAFGSSRAVTQASKKELENIVGIKKAVILERYIALNK